MESVAYEELLRKDGRVMTHVVGTSMLPLWRSRESIVIVEAADRVPPRRGDVVLYKAGNTYILHRIMRVTPEEYLIRGDNTRDLEHVPRGALLATVTGFYRRPDSRLVTRDDFRYRLYRLALPVIRPVRRAAGRARRAVRRIFRASQSVRRDRR